MPDIKLYIYIIFFIQSYTCLKPTSVSHEITLFSTVIATSYNFSLSVFNTFSYDSKNSKSCYMSYDLLIVSFNTRFDYNILYTYIILNKNT